jgi:hypothetical protein
MKCPHCSYVSFEYLDTCRKCSKDLTTHKGQYGIEFLEPVSLGILTFVEGRAATSAAVGGALDISKSDETASFLDEEVATEELSSVSGKPDEINFDFGDSAAVEVPQGSSTDEIGIDMGEGMGGIASDSGFSLNLGDDIDGGGDLNLSFGDDESSASTVVEETGGISLNLDSSGDEGGQIVMKDIDISLEDEGGGPIVVGAEPSKDSLMDLDLDDIGGLEIDMGEAPPQKEPTIKLSGEEAKKAAAAPDIDFTDIDFNLDDKDIFGDNKDDKSGDIDLGDIDLHLGDDDMGMKF